MELDNPMDRIRSMQLGNRLVHTPRRSVLSLVFSSVDNCNPDSVTDGVSSSPSLRECQRVLPAKTSITAFIFVSFFAETLPVLFAGQFLIGLPFGFYNCLAQAYASEIAPLPLRGLFTMYNQSCWCTGQLLTAGILFGFRNGTTKVSLGVLSQLGVDGSGHTRPHSPFNGHGQSPSSASSGLRLNPHGGWSEKVDWKKPLDPFEDSRVEDRSETPTMSLP